jgi:hypothetical protein
MRTMSESIRMDNSVDGFKRRSNDGGNAKAESESSESRSQGKDKALLIKNAINPDTGR